MSERVLIAVVLALIASTAVAALIWGWLVLQAVATLIAMFAQGALLT